MRKAQELRELVSIDQVLLYLGAELPSASVYHGWVAMHCPFHEDRDASASIHLAQGLFNCHGCEAPKDNDRAGDIFDVAGWYIGTTDFTRQREWIEWTFLR